MGTVTEYFFPLAYVPHKPKEPFFSPDTWLGKKVKELNDLDSKSYLVSQTRLVVLDLFILCERLFTGFPKPIGKMSLVWLNGLGLFSIPGMMSPIYKALLDVRLSFKQKDASQLLFSTIKVINAISDPILSFGTCTASTLSLFSFSSRAWEIYSVVNPYAAVNILLWSFGFFSDMYINTQLERDLKEFAIDIALEQIATKLKNEKGLGVEDNCELIINGIQMHDEQKTFPEKMKGCAIALENICIKLKSDPQHEARVPFIEAQAAECQELLGKIRIGKLGATYTTRWPAVAQVFCDVLQNPLCDIPPTLQAVFALRTIYQLDAYDFASLRQDWFAEQQKLNKDYPNKGRATEQDEPSKAYLIAEQAMLREIYGKTLIAISSKLYYKGLDFSLNLAGTVGRIVRKFFPLTAFEISIDTSFAILWWYKYYKAYQDSKNKKDNIDTAIPLKG